MIPAVLPFSGLLALTVVWIIFIIRTRPRRLNKELVKTEGEKFVETVKALTEKEPVPASDRGFDPMKKNINQLKRDMLIAVAREKQKKDNEAKKEGEQ